MQHKMEIINKIKKDGLMPAIKFAAQVLSEKINKSVFNIAQHFPIKDNYIVFESSPDLSDNAYALYDYMDKNGILKKYKTIWLVNHPKNYKNTKSVLYLQKGWGKPAIRTYAMIAVSKYYICDHNCMITKKRDEQTVIYLGHGIGFKASKGTPNLKDNFSYILSHGNLSTEMIMHFYNADYKKMAELGYPRNDYLFEKNDVIKNKFETEYHFSNYSKVILWMPTFRQSISKQLSEDYIKNDTGLPLFNTPEDLNQFDQFLKEENILLILKLHHLQANLPVFAQKFSNLLILKDSDLNKLGTQLYQFIPLTDALITDYSSIFVSYLLLDKPIMYTLDDYDEYEKSRGFKIENTKQYLRGDHIYKVTDLEKALLDIKAGKDKYKKERNETIKTFYNYPDNNSAKRIVEFFGL